ncbi:helix-turn-helix domain-containing protein [uncultured Clostridium sp.]|uniref:helix-turn-helix domain-containing protein n=1 Tax=uncultured Clostridium sp. TaxID=59620 RepID=UPI0026ED115E|nr:helix-turn-helix domain-containing protein [uncultured Clostridium sp.]
MNSNMFDVIQLSGYLNISTSLIRKLVRKKEIPFNRIGVKLMFQKSEIDKWLKENQNANINGEER